MDITTVSNWVEGYKKAWASNKPQDISILFTEDASYYTNPFAKPIRGNQAIVMFWTEEGPNVP